MKQKERRSEAQEGRTKVWLQWIFSSLHHQDQTSAKAVGRRGRYVT